MRVRDLTSRQVVTIGTSDSCLEAVMRMHRARVRHLPVVNRDGKWSRRASPRTCTSDRRGSYVIRLAGVRSGGILTAFRRPSVQSPPDHGGDMTRELAPSAGEP